MKKLIALLILFLFAFSCKPESRKPVKTENEIKLYLYSIPGTTYIKGVGLDTIHFTRDSLRLGKVQKKDTLVFTYPYRYTMDYTDTLIIANSNVALRENLKYISEKTFSLDGKLIVIKKYLQDIKPRGPVGNIFINESLGIVITRKLSHPYSAHIACYDVENHRDLHKMIAADSAFFEFTL